ncbi:hypothetical protein Nham_1372 [Nitrobacter hamburgensis X14]|uniref:Uncharacterized protein n=1 Tax=Nitrobacter hamburgensis (strain DSM 10229 / NCIMB 13809 / X14) TaxID=323097 RepID=Q1QNK1_NITHX|nr:hypothetical protein [Nitrobacter hamburgensis]ABE62196.1 hypothetical protein Nham_1372 [Nitrobacter hamburgensis X14]
MKTSKFGIDAYARLVDGLAEDLLSKSDDQLAAEICERGDDPAAVSARARAVFEKAVRDHGKRRLAAARTAVEADVKSPRKEIRLDPTEARARLERILRRHPETANKLTLAARKGEGLSDTDALGLLADLEELGIKDEDQP